MAGQVRMRELKSWPITPVALIKIGGNNLGGCCPPRPPAGLRSLGQAISIFQSISIYPINCNLWLAFFNLWLSFFDLWPAFKLTHLHFSCRRRFFVFQNFGFFTRRRPKKSQLFKNRDFGGFRPSNHGESIAHIRYSRLVPIENIVFFQKSRCWRI